MSRQNSSGILKLRTWLDFLRIKHWIKNGLVIVPIFFSGRFFHESELLHAGYSFLIFSVMASAVYIFNDINDIDHDRRHPEKCRRPLPAGEISLRAAKFWFVVLILVSCLMSLSFAPLSGLVFLLVYLALNVGYSLGLKNIPVIDFSILASGFVLRIFYGSACCRVEISHWLFLCVLAASLFMGIGKRRNEIRQVGGDGGFRKVLSMYSEVYLDRNMYLAAALALIFYSLWAASPASGSPFMVYTVPFVLLLFFQYSFS